MIDDSPKRFDRIVAILIQLQSRKIVKAQDLADRFGVSLRTIYRDVKSLESSGVPILSESGVGYSIMDGYRLPPVMFTKEEAGSFVAAEKLMQQFTDQNLRQYFESAMYKVRSVLRSAEKEWVHALDTQIFVKPSAPMFNKDIPDALEIILDGIAGATQIALLYLSADAEEELPRMIEPLKLFHEHSNWYLYAYCHLRKDYRQFRTDRIKGIKRTDKPHHKQHDLTESLPESKMPEQFQTIRIEVSKKFARHIERSKRWYGFVSEQVQAESVEMTFHVSDCDEGFSRWYLMFADHARILEPESLRKKVTQLAEKCLQQTNTRQTVGMM